MSKSYATGFKHGSSGSGTNAYKPGKRKPGGKSLAEYNAGFADGWMENHEATRKLRQELAWLNLPKATRGPCPACQDE